MNIGFIVDNICNNGGGERAVTSVCSLLQGKGCNATIFSCYSTSKENICYPIHRSVKILHLGDRFCDSFFYKNFPNRKLWTYVKNLLFIRRYAKENSIDFLMSTPLWCSPIFSFFIKGAKTVVCKHVDFNFMTPFDRFMARCFYRFSDAVVLLHREHVKNYTFIKNEKKFIIPNPLPFSAKTKSECKNKRMLVLSRFTHEKGIDLLLDVAQLLKEKIPDWRIDIYGDGPDKEKLKAIAESKQLTDFVFFHPPTREAEEKYLESSIYLMTSRSEGLPMVLLEAQSCGVPAVSYDCEVGPRCIIANGNNGYLIPLENKELFTEAVLKLASSLELRQEMGRNAIENSKNYQPEKIIDAWFSLFRELSSRK